MRVVSIICLTLSILGCSQNNTQRWPTAPTPPVLRGRSCTHAMDSDTAAFMWIGDLLNGLTLRHVELKSQLARSSATRHEPITQRFGPRRRY